MLTQAQASRALRSYAVVADGARAAIAARILAVAGFEAKCGLAFDAFLLGRIRSACAVRAEELTDITASAAREDHQATAMVERALCAEEPESHFVAALAGIRDSLWGATGVYLSLADAIADGPSVYALRHARLDIEQLLGWRQAEGELGVKVPDVVRLACDPVPIVLVPVRDGAPYNQPTAVARDSRFGVFADTRNYACARSSALDECDERERELAQMLWLQRDELDAIETFAMALHDFAKDDPSLKDHMTRLMWDESRHALIGQRELLRRGIDTYALPFSLIGINVRSRLSGLEAFAQITLFGELNIVGAIRRLAGDYGRIGDPAGIALQFVHRDELMHLRRGIGILKELHPSESLGTIRSAVGDAAIDQLRKLGVLGEDFETDITPSRILALIGE